MTKKQKELLDWLRTWFREHEHAPSLDEIAAGLGTAKSAAHRMLGMLERDGYIVRLPFSARNLRLTEMAVPPAPAPVDRMRAAVEALFSDGVLHEDESAGVAVVDMNRLGALELAWKGDA